MSGTELGSYFQCFYFDTFGLCHSWIPVSRQRRVSEFKKRRGSSVPLVLQRSDDRQSRSGGPEGWLRHTSLSQHANQLIEKANIR